MGLSHCLLYFILELGSNACSQKGSASLGTSPNQGYKAITTLIRAGNKRLEVGGGGGGGGGGGVGPFGCRYAMELGTYEHHQGVFAVRTPCIAYDDIIVNKPPYMNVRSFCRAANWTTQGTSSIR